MTRSKLQLLRATVFVFFNVLSCYAIAQPVLQYVYPGDTTVVEITRINIEEAIAEYAQSVYQSSNSIDDIHILDSLSAINIAANAIAMGEGDRCNYEYGQAAAFFEIAKHHKSSLLNDAAVKRLSAYRKNLLNGSRLMDIPIGLVEIIVSQNLPPSIGVLTREFHFWKNYGDSLRESHPALLKPVFNLSSKAKVYSVCRYNAYKMAVALKKLSADSFEYFVNSYEQEMPSYKWCQFNLQRETVTGTYTPDTIMLHNDYESLQKIDFDEIAKMPKAEKDYIKCSRRILFKENTAIWAQGCRSGCMVSREKMKLELIPPRTLILTKLYQY